MKLSEIRSLKASRPHKDSMEFKKSDLWLGIGSKSDLDQADVEVEFEYEAPSHTDHPYGEGSAREYHGAGAEILAVKLVKDTDRFNEDGEVIGQLKAGTDLMKQDWWDDKWNDWYADEIVDKMSR